MTTTNNKSLLDDTIELVDAIGAGQRRRVKSILKRCAEEEDKQRLRYKRNCESGLHIRFVEASDAFGQTPLTKASQMGDLDMVKLLVEQAGASVNGISYQQKSHNNNNNSNKGQQHRAFRSPLVSAVLACHLDVAAYLLRRGATVQDTHMYGMTCLHLACDKGSATMVQILLQNGANVNAQDQRGWTPLYQAAQRGHLACVQMLVRWKNIKDGPAEDKHRNNRKRDSSFGEGDNDEDALMMQFPVGTTVWVCRKDSPSKPSQGEVAFAPGQPVDFCPHHHNDWVGVRLTGDSVGLGKNNGSVNGVRYFAADDKCGVFVRLSALTLRGAALRPSSRGQHLEDINDKDKHTRATTTLSDCNANLASCGRHRRGPLHVACQRGRLAVVQYLVEHTCVDWRARDASGATPLHLACSEGHLDVAQFLVERFYHNQNNNSNNSTILVDDDKDVLLETPLWAACVAGAYDLAEYLIEQCDANVNTRNAKDQTLLFRSCCPYRPVSINFLLDHGADVNQTICINTSLGCSEITLLGWAAFSYRSDIVSHLLLSKDKPWCENLNVEAGSRTPLWLACHAGNLEAVEQLVVYHEAQVDDEHAADPDTGLTPLGVAAQEKRYNVVRFLVHHTATPLAVRVLLAP